MYDREIIADLKDLMKEFLFTREITKELLVEVGDKIYATLMDEELAYDEEEETPEEYARITHRGRQIEESPSPGYCGGCTIAVHTLQINDKKCWIQGQLDMWYNIGKENE